MFYKFILFFLVIMNCFINCIWFYRVMQSYMWVNAKLYMGLCKVIYGLIQYYMWLFSMIKSRFHEINEGTVQERLSGFI